MTYGICINYIVTPAGIDAQKEKRIDSEGLFAKKYEGIYYYVIVEDATKAMWEKYEPLLQQLKKDFRKNQNTKKSLKDLEEIVEAKPQRRYVSTEAKHRPRNKKWHQR